MKYLVLLVAMSVFGCAGHHNGKWEYGSSQTYVERDLFVLDTGEVCGEVNRAEGDTTYYSFVHGFSVGQWTSLIDACKAVESNWRCK